MEGLKIHKEDPGLPYLKIWNWEMDLLNNLYDWCQSHTEPIGFILFSFLWIPSYLLCMLSALILFPLRAWSVFTSKTVNFIDDVTTKNRFLGYLLLLMAISTPIILSYFFGVVYQKCHKDRQERLKNEEEWEQLVRSFRQSRNNISQSRMRTNNIKDFKPNKNIIKHKI